MGEEQARSGWGTWKRVPGAVWTIGFVSLFMDVSSEMIHALLPLYLVGTLGASTLAVGVIEGIAEATASITKVFSGALSDWLGKRKLLAAFGYALAAVTKPVFPLAPSIGWLVAARFVDRIGKGIRGAPRDALVADIASPELRGASFGLRQSLDTLGALLGPLFAMLFMWLFADNFTMVFWIAVAPAFVSAGLMIFAVREPQNIAARRTARMPLHRSELARLGAAYWKIVAIATAFTLARFSEAFLVLKGQDIGLPLALVPLVMVVMNVAYTLSAYPAGALSDRIDRMTLLVVGLFLLLAADLVLAFSAGLIGLAAGAALWGLHMGFTQGLLSALVADTAPPELRGTAFGVFNLVTGIALLAASMIAGGLWDLAGAEGTFLGGAGFTLCTLLGLTALRIGQRGRRTERRNDAG